MSVIYKLNVDLSRAVNDFVRTIMSIGQKLQIHLPELLLGWWEGEYACICQNVHVDFSQKLHMHSSKAASTLIKQMPIELKMYLLEAPFGFVRSSLWIF